MRMLTTKAMRRAFTLIELLTVMAITAILMGLIIVPLVQSFNMTRMADGFGQAQDQARVLTERIAKEIGNAVSVRAGFATVNTFVNGEEAKIQRHSLVVTVPGEDGAQVETVLPYSRIDVIPAAEGDPVRGPGGGFFNPSTGMEDPTQAAPKGQVVLPVAPGMKLVRYFVSLRDPFQDYNNPYDGMLNARNSQQDNLYVLRRSEVVPVLPGGGVNTLFFEIDPLTGNSPVLDDPRFFTPNRDEAGRIITNDEKADRIRNWLGQGGGNSILPANNISRSTIVTQVSRFDMIQAVIDRQLNRPVYDNGIPRIVSLVQFRPAQVSNDPAEGYTAVRMGDESGSSMPMAPDVYATQYGLWDRALVRNWPMGWNPGDTGRNEYNVARLVFEGGDQGAPLGYSIYVYDPDMGSDDQSGGVETFDISYYDRAVTNGWPYPFTQAMQQANGRSGWMSSPAARNAFVAFSLNGSRGKVLTSFNISQVGTPGNPVPEWNPQNLPGLATSIDGPYSPQNDPDLGGEFYEERHRPVNEKFNKVWVDYPNLQPEVHRFIDLRVTPQADGTWGPMHPQFGLPRALIVPGSEEVYGPDQNPGPNFGRTIRYTRTTRAPGPNQYRINYVDQPEPTNANGDIDYSVLGLGPQQLAGFDPYNYNEQNFVSAVIQPRFKRGYIQLNSDPNVPLPLGQVLVAYRFQFNGAGNRGLGSKEDVFAVDYDTRQLINVLLTIRNYPQSTVSNPQNVTLKSTAAVRNYIR
jgi:prepilin-type N-terminal cleavage/methylation domain-containing protein